MRAVFPIALVASFVLAARPAAACRYNVRDVGFVELDAKRWSLVLLHDGSDAALRAEFDAAVHGVAADVPVTAREQTAGEGGTVTGRALAQRFGVSHFPSLVLVDPGDRALTVASPSDLGSLDALWAAVERAVDSRLRREIAGASLDAYAVVLVLEGEDAPATAELRRLADDAVRNMSEHMGELPKAVANPPRVISVDLSTRRQERVLAWSLGLAPGDVSQPAVAVLYGRGRVMGPVLDRAKATRTAIEEALRIIGQSCECDLDRKWIDTPTIPLPWPRPLRMRAVAALGFDPESPLIRSEISRLLARGAGSGAAPRPASSGALADAGYSESPVASARASEASTTDIGDPALLSPDEIDAIIAGATLDVAPRSPASSAESVEPVATSGETGMPTPASRGAADAPTELSRRIWLWIGGAFVVVILLAAGAVWLLRGSS